MVKAKSSYTFGSMPTQKNDVTLSLDEEKFVMEFADSSNIYTCEGKVTHQGIRQVTLAINGQAFSQLFVRMDKDKPLMKADLKFAEHLQCRRHEQKIDGTVACFVYESLSRLWLGSEP